jgi:hypothetical protein
MVGFLPLHRYNRGCEKRRANKTKHILHAVIRREIEDVFFAALRNAGFHEMRVFGSILWFAIGIVIRPPLRASHWTLRILATAAGGLA